MFTVLLIWLNALFTYICTSWEGCREGTSVPLTHSNSLANNATRTEDLTERGEIVLKGELHGSKDEARVASCQRSGAAALQIERVVDTR